jgi:hypothetical protein
MGDGRWEVVDERVMEEGKTNRDRGCTGQERK